MAAYLALLYERGLRRERVFKDPLDPLEVSDEHLLRYYRFPRQEILNLCDEMRVDLERPTERSHPLPVHVQVLCALRFYASGTFQSVIGDSVGISQASVCKAIKSVTIELVIRAYEEIQLPATEADIIQTKQGFYRMANFPNVIGAVDCTHIPIKAPYDDEYLYVNRKGFHSINVQAICNSKMMFTSFVVDYPGSTHDSFIMTNCGLLERFQRGDYGHSYLLGDSGYALSNHLLTPYINPAGPGQVNYNISHMKTRVTIEQTFGVLKSRFRCLHKSGGALQYDPLKCCKLIVACMLLHNRCIMRNIEMVEELVVDDNEPEGFLQAENREGANERARVVEAYFT